jgi:hypothetical protein
MPVIPAVPYLFLGLQDIQWAVRNSRGACKLARTPHLNNKKKKAGAVLMTFINLFFKKKQIGESFQPFGQA